MQASGGAMTTEAAKSRAVNMVNSGPAGGALATALFGRLAGEDKLISVDMGGTSFDIGLVVGGQPRVKPEGEIEGYPVKIPLIDVEGIGAGGGSIAWGDAGGALNVGPASAGADPGPVCYGRGGSKPTVTDANLVLGRLNPDYFLGREMRLHPNEAREAIKKYVVDPIAATGGPTYSIEEAAAGIIRVVNANMIRGINVNTTQKGYDVREFSMLAFGGAGALHAVDLAQEMGVSRVIIPPFCAVFSAFGAVTSDVRHDYVNTVALSQQAATATRLQTAFTKLEIRARQQLTAEKVTDEDWDKILGVNLKGPFFCTRAAKPALAVSGGEIVMTSSVAGLAGIGSSIPYCASKAALNNMTISLARALGPDNIRVNAVAPGFIAGDWLEQGLGEVFEFAKQANEKKAPLGRVCEPDDVAQAIVGIITGSDLVTGHVLPVEGGLLIGW